MHWVGVRIPRGMIGTKSGKKKIYTWAMYYKYSYTGKSCPQRYENLDALFMASASSPIRAIHRSINSLFSCLSFRDCASAILS